MSDSWHRGITRSVSAHLDLVIYDHKILSPLFCPHNAWNAVPPDLDFARVWREIRQPPPNTVIRFGGQGKSVPQIWIHTGLEPNISGPRPRTPGLFEPKRSAGAWSVTPAPETLAISGGESTYPRLNSSPDPLILSSDLWLR